jgi:plasmid stabilization system protein ParE
MIEWSAEAKEDLVRLHWFLLERSERAASSAVQRLIQAPMSLADQPRRGPVVERYLPREVRRLLVGAYELLYEVRGNDIYVVSIFHTREER